MYIFYQSLPPCPGTLSICSLYDIFLLASSRLLSAQAPLAAEPIYLQFSVLLVYNVYYTLSSSTHDITASTVALLMQPYLRNTVLSCRRFHVPGVSACLTVPGFSGPVTVTCRLISLDGRAL